MSARGIYTIGCSTHSIESFVELLKKYHITALADVRSVPYSKFTPQFNKETLKKTLKQVGIFYIPLAEEFGARRKEPEAYTNKRVDFIKTANLPKFLEGVKRIDTGLKKGFSIALMCAEKDPLDCHRFVLVSRNLEKQLYIDVQHIHLDGSLEDKNSIEQRMIKNIHLQTPLFNEDNNTLIEKIYTVLSEKIAYSAE